MSKPVLMRCGASVIVLALSFAVMGCEDEAQKTADKDAPDAGPTPALMDKNINDAVQSARLKPGAPGGSGDAERPMTGVFPPGAADRAHAPGAPIHVTVLGKGSEPRIKLRPPLKLGGTKTLKVQVAKRFQTQLLPNIDHTLAVTVSEPKGDAGVGPNSIQFKIKKARPSQQQPGGLPPGLDKQVKKIVGSTVSAKIAVDGSLYGEQVTLANGADQGLAELVNALGDTLLLFFSPWPDEPLGVGGYWIARDRTVVGGMKMVRYRVTRIEKVQGDEAALSVDIRYYANDASQLPAGAVGQPGQKLVLVGLEALGKAAFTHKSSQFLPTSGQLKLPMVLQIGDDPAQPQRSMAVQLESAAGIIPADKPAAGN